MKDLQLQGPKRADSSYEKGGAIVPISLVLQVMTRLARKSSKRYLCNLPVVLFYIPISIDNHRFYQ